MSVVLDASALLAYLQGEPGGDAVEAALGESMISAVNWAEVVQKARAGNVKTAGLRSDLEALGLGIEPFTADQAELAGGLWKRTRTVGLSLGDRACLAFGMDTDRMVYTTDRAWERAELGLSVRIIR